MSNDASTPSINTNTSAANVKFLIRDGKKLPLKRPKVGRPFKSPSLPFIESLNLCPPLIGTPSLFLRFLCVFVVFKSFVFVGDDEMSRLFNSKTLSLSMSSSSSLSEASSDPNNASSSYSPSPPVEIYPCVLPLFLPIPRYTSWVASRNNIRCEDDTVMRYVPYFNDEDVTLIDTELYDRIVTEGESEIFCEAREATVLYMVQKYALRLHKYDVSSYHIPMPTSPGTLSLLSAQKNAMMSTEMEEVCLLYIRAEVILALQECIEALSNSQIVQLLERGSESLRLNQRYLQHAGSSCYSSSSSSSSSGSQIEQAVDSSLLALVGLPSTGFSNEEVFRPGHGLRNADNYVSLVDAYRELFCRRCFIYDCASHGISQPLPLKREDPKRPFRSNFLRSASGEEEQTLNSLAETPDEEEQSEQEQRKVDKMEVKEVGNDDGESESVDDEESARETSAEEISFIDKFASFPKYMNELICYREKKNHLPDVKSNSLSTKDHIDRSQGSEPEEEVVVDVMIPPKLYDPFQIIPAVNSSKPKGKKKSKTKEEPIKFSPAEGGLMRKLLDVFGRDDTYVKLFLLFLSLLLNLSFSSSLFVRTLCFIAPLLLTFLHLYY